MMARGRGRRELVVLRGRRENPAMPLSGEERERLGRLHAILRDARGGSPSRLDADALDALVPLYRYGSTVLARLESASESPRVLRALRRLLSEAHGLLYGGERADRGSPLLRALRFLAGEAPRTLRAEWRLAALSFGLFYGLALVAYAAVRHDPELALSLLDPAAVLNEVQQLEATPEGEPFRGNFTFGIGESPRTAGWIMTHNMWVGVVFFASSLLPPLYALLLGANALMLGTYTAVAAHWGQAGAISSILWCHGVLEIQAIILAGTAGLVLIRAWIAPGPFTRDHALRVEARRAWCLLAPVFALLFAAGLIEGYVSPHAPLGVRLAVAVGSGLLLVAWGALGGRGGARVA